MRRYTHMEVEARFGVCIKYPPNALSGSDWDGALLRDNLVAVGHLYDPPSARLDEFQVGSTTLPHPVCLGWGVYLKVDGKPCIRNVKIHSFSWTNQICAAGTDELTEMKTRSASLMAESMSVEKNRFLPLHDSTTSLSPG